MTPFLRQVARHYCRADSDPSELLFVLPSQRAVVFFEHYFAREVAGSGKGVVFAPRTLSIDSFFTALSPLGKADRITLLVELYDCYRSIRPGCESLDEFVFWGDMILSDYDDVDKYLVDAKDLFRNVAQLKGITDDLSYLSPSQREAISGFISLFKTGGEFKERFTALWSTLWPMYETFNRVLLEKSISYDGSLLRDLVRRCESQGASAVLGGAFPHCSKVVFCGLNALNKCEKKILSLLQTAGLAEFCWDYEDDWIRDPANRSSRFLEENIRLFPRAFTLEECGTHPRFEVVSVPSAIAQTRLLSDILGDESIPMDERTAIVLPDEAMLMPLLSALPDRVEKVNVTMGFPIISSSFYSLMDYALQMQLGLRRSPDGVSFHHRQVWSIVSNNIFVSLSDEQTREKVGEVRRMRRYYVSSDDLSGTPLLDAVFRPADDLAQYALSLLDYIGSAIARDESLKSELTLEMDFAMEYSKAVRLLDAKKLDIRPTTWVSLLRSLLQRRSVPFKGEPLSGLQIMGPLEVRALDFENLVILNCNEGVFPRRNVASSFIPPLLRRGFDMPTYEHQDAVWAYYFYRMVQRPSKVWMLSDSRAEGLKSGEESRYIKQLQYHFGAPLVRRGVFSSPGSTVSDEAIAKTPAHIRTIRSRALSATALNAYLSCPAKFYYSFVEGLSSSEDVAENLDSGMIGTVYHAVMQRLYADFAGARVSVGQLRDMIDGEERIREMVEANVKEQLSCDQIRGRDIVVTTLICKYVKATLERDLDFTVASGRDYFELYGLEMKFEAWFEGFRIKGYIDRLDSFAPGCIRVVDYKTGAVSSREMLIDDSNAVKVAAAAFDPESSSRSPVALQFFIYDFLLAYNGLDVSRKVQNCVYSVRGILGEVPLSADRNDLFCNEMTLGLKGLLARIVDPDVPFRRCDKASTCSLCDFKTICGR